MIWVNTSGVVSTTTQKKGEVKLSRVEEGEEEESKEQNDVQHPQDPERETLNLSDVSPWTTRTGCGVHGNVRAGQQRDKEGTGY